MSGDAMDAVREGFDKMVIDALTETDEQTVLKDFVVALYMGDLTSINRLYEKLPKDVKKEIERRTSGAST